jgi:HK97 gp10 family phage protein
MDNFKTVVRGLREARDKMLQMANDLRGKEFTDAMMDAAMIVSRDAKILAPVDRGPLRASITPDVRVEGQTVQGVVGSNLMYAPFMELGTGTPAGNPPVKMPPPAALEGWAKRHGTTGFAVAWAIFKAGGLKPRKFLERALTQNHDRIVEKIGDFVTRIVKK